jgi:hypothetical protein
MEFKSNAEALLVAIPMVLGMIVGFFRLDEHFGRPARLTVRRRSFSHQDTTGVLICVEPDGQVSRMPGHGRNPN